MSFQVGGLHWHHPSWGVLCWGRCGGGGCFVGNMRGASLVASWGDPRGVPLQVRGARRRNHSLGRSGLAHAALAELAKARPLAAFAHAARAAPLLCAPRCPCSLPAGCECHTSKSWSGGWGRPTRRARARLGPHACVHACVHACTCTCAASPVEHRAASPGARPSLLPPPVAPRRACASRGFETNSNRLSPTGGQVGAQDD